MSDPILPRPLRFLCAFLVRYWMINLLSLTGLAIGYAACILIGLYVRDELNFDRFMPGAEKVFLLSASYGPKGEPLVDSDITPAGMARWMRESLPELDDTTRLNPVEWPMKSARHEAYEHFFWADANLFDVLKLPAAAGDLRTALSQPGSVVMTQKMARLYFGREDVIGQTLVLDEQIAVHVTAILRDFPANTHMSREIFVSSQANYAMLKVFDWRQEYEWPSCYTYVRLKPGASPTRAEGQLASILTQHWHSDDNQPERMWLVPLLSLHFQPSADGQMKPRGHKDTVAAMIGVAVLVLTLASVNFAGLMTARIDERTYEMAIRKALGARKHDLILQVLLEAVAVSFLGMGMAVALAERVVQLINPSLGLELSLWSNPALLVWVAAVTATVTGIASGLYPALVLSSVSPIQGLRGAEQRALVGFSLRRQGWLVMQFALLITLLVCAHTVYRQWTYATGSALNFNAERVVLINNSPIRAQGSAYKRDVLTLAGVAGAAYSRWVPMEQDIRPAWIKSRDGALIKFTRHSVDPDFFRLYGVPLLAGQNFSDTISVPGTPRAVLINTSAMRALGYSRPQDAVGHQLVYGTDHTQLRSQIIGVVGDMRFSTVRAPMRPMMFDNQADFFTLLSVKLRPGLEDETLKAMDRLWKEDHPGIGPMDWRLFSAYLADQYRDMHQQEQIFTIFSLVGICLSGLCLSGLSIFLSRHRLREMAIRRALGADFWTIFRLRLDPFIRPLVLSNLLAWPLAGILMASWLGSFADHVGLTPISFVGASLVTSAVAVLTLSIHAAASAGDKPVQPLRYE